MRGRIVDRHSALRDRALTRRRPEPRGEFLGDGGAADHRELFEHQGLEAALCEIERGGQAVVPAADDESVGHDCDRS